jgi:hypothetical protein
LVGVITTRRIVYRLGAIVVLLVVGTIIGLIWATPAVSARAHRGGARVGDRQPTAGIGEGVLLESAAAG